MTAIARLILRQRAAVILLAVILLISGIVTALRMQLELFPNVSLGTVTIVTAYPGASSTTVLNDVTKPIEVAVAGVPSIDTLLSTSADNASIVTVRFSYGTDLNQAEAKVSQAVAGVQLPAGAQQPKVSPVDFSAFPILYFAVSGKGSTSLQDTYRLVQEKIQPQLQQIQGVAAADIGGGSSPQVYVRLHPALMARFGLTPAAVDAALLADNVSIPGGAVTAGGVTLPVVTTGTLTSLPQIRNVPIGPAPGSGTSISRAAGTPPGTSHSVRLGDIATVSLGHSSINTIGTTPGQVTGIVRYNGRPAISITIRKNSDANIVTVANAVTAQMKTLQTQLPQVQIGTIYDSSTYIKRSVSQLLQDGLFGAAFAVLVIFVFLLSVRTTLVTAVSIPLSILIAIIFLNIWGFTLNIMTISAIAVAVGRVVDDAIVVLENVYRHIQEGEARFVATVNGVREVARAIIGSTATTIGVFLPIAFIGGILGQFFAPFAVTVTLSLVASLLVALTVVPALGSLFITRRKHVHRETRLQRIYTPMLSWALTHRAITIIVAGVLFLGSVSLVTVIPKGFFPASNEPLAQASLVLPPGTSLQRTTQEVARLERSVIAHQPGLNNWETIVGYNNAAAERGGNASTGNAATLLITFNQGTDMVRELDRLRAEAASFSRSGEIVSVEGVSNGPPSTVDMLVRGTNSAGITRATRQVLAKVQAVPGLVNATSSLSARKPFLDIKVDPNRAAQHSLTPQGVALAVRADLTGASVTRVNLTGVGSADIFVQVDPAATSTPAQIKALQVGTPSVPLAEVATVSRSMGPVDILRRDQQTVGEVTATVNNASDAGKVTANVSAAVTPLIKDWASRDVTIEQAGLGQQISQGFINLGLAMLIAIGLVYLLMVLLFRSLLVPFVILFSLPLAVIGALLALAVTQRELDMSAGIGCLMLIGVVVTNAVVLLDLVQQRLDAGLPLHDALMEGGRTRVRPILMTACATILALTPLAILGSGGGIVAANLATVVIGGLLTSTLLTLVVVPVIYSLFSSLRRRLTGTGLHEDPVPDAAWPAPASPVPVGE